MAKQPEWLDNAVFYEIYPQSFMDSNGDGIGDFQGIISKLDYIKDLGCTAIWMNPCFESPFSDAGYDISDYYKAAPRYGTNEDLKQLFEEVHKRNMHILLDLVPCHTSTEHKWFKESMKPEKNEFTDRYIWTDNVWTAPKDYGTIRGISDRDGSCIVSFFSCQPAINYGWYKPTESWQQGIDDEGPKASLEELKNIMRFWLGLGCDGFRVDMAGTLVKGDEDCKGTIILWNRIRDMLEKEYPEAAMVSEWGEPAKSLQGGFHMDFLLHFGPSHYNDLFRCEEPYFSSRGKGTAKEFVENYIKSYELSEKKGLICIPSGNHDMDRLARSLKGDELKLAFAFLLSMPGAPFIYAGDEIGMNYVEGLTSKEGGYNRTGSRTPLQWDDTPNAGFSSAGPDKLYLPQDNSPDRPTVKNQLETEGSLLKEIQKLNKIRMENKALQSCGEIEFISSEAYPLIYKRKADKQTIAVIINPSKMSFELDSIPNGKIIYQLGKAEFKTNKWKIEGQSALFVELN